MHAAGLALPRRRDYADELLRAFPGGRVVNSEGSVVDIPFQLPNGRPTALRVSLPPQFPQERPTLSVLVPLQHPAVDATGRVHVRGVEQWGSGSAPGTPRRAGGAAPGIAPPDLVAVVQEAFAALLADGAAQQGLTSPRAGGAGSSSGRAGMARGPGGGPGGAGGGVGAAGDGEAAGVEAFLESLPTSQLEAMLSDEEALRKAAAQWLKDTPAARALEDVRRQNQSVAASNLALGRSIEEARGHVAIVRSGEYAAMRALFEELRGRQEAVMAKIGPPVMLARVREEADKADAASDELLERFQAGSLGVEAFVESYVAAREAFHVVDLKRQAAEHHMLA